MKLFNNLTTTLLLAAALSFSSVQTASAWSLSSVATSISNYVSKNSSNQRSSASNASSGYALRANRLQHQLKQGKISTREYDKQMAQLGRAIKESNKTSGYVSRNRPGVVNRNGSSNR